MEKMKRRPPCLLSSFVFEQRGTQLHSQTGPPACSKCLLCSVRKRNHEITALLASC